MLFALNFLGYLRLPFHLVMQLTTRLIALIARFAKRQNSSLIFA
jgi:hypothetical protein